MVVIASLVKRPREPISRVSRTAEKPAASRLFVKAK